MYFRNSGLAANPGKRTSDNRPVTQVMLDTFSEMLVAGVAFVFGKETLIS